MRVAKKSIKIYMKRIIPRYFFHIWNIQNNKTLFIQASEDCVTTGGGNTGRKCIFPVKYNGIRYSHCIKSNSTEEVPWCSTMVTKRHHHVGNQKQWGYCSPSCPFPKEKGLLVSNQNLFNYAFPLTYT